MDKTIGLIAGCVALGAAAGMMNGFLAVIVAICAGFLAWMVGGIVQELGESALTKAYQWHHNSITRKSEKEKLK